MRKRITEILLFVVSVVMIVSCDGTKFVADNQYLLTQNTITAVSPGVNVGALSPYITQQPNSKWFSALKVPLGIYCLSGRDSTKALNRFFRRLGEAPVILDTVKVLQSKRNILTAVQNDGYLDAEVVAEQQVIGKRVKLNYIINPKQKYYIRNVVYNVLDARIDSLLKADALVHGKVSSGDVFSINNLQAERKRITALLNEQGYLYFNKEAITLNVDSSKVGNFVDVTLNIGLYRQNSNEDFRNHPYYTIRDVRYHPTAGQKMKIRQNVLDNNTLLRKGELYKASNVQGTYNKFSKLQALRSANIRLTEVHDSISMHGGSQSDHRLLDADIQLTRKKTHSISVQPEGTNTAGDFGAALSLTYENRNLFHGSEVLSIQGRGAFEAIKGLEGYSTSNYQEYGIEGKLTFPKFLLPGLKKSFRRSHDASSEVLISYNWQNRPEFRRRVFTAAWKYRWKQPASGMIYQWDMIDVDYVSMPWISETFKRDYLDSETNRNAILRYNYEDLLVMKMGFGMTYTDESNFLKINIETAGNLLYGMSHLFNAPKNDDGQYKVALVAFAQYVKTDIDYTHIFKLDRRNSLALHARVGVGVPYGNSNMLPYEKRYFAGGANSVRGWSVRELGPGRYEGKDGRIDFINQTGDFRLDLNAELRTDLFWKFQGALFIDAGNIWTLKKYADQPGGHLTFRNFYEAMAVAYGVGLRLNFDYFILRLDLGMKAINPNYHTSKEHFPIINHKFSRDYALHFAVGLPF